MDEKQTDQSWSEKGWMHVWSPWLSLKLKTSCIDLNWYSARWEVNNPKCFFSFFVMYIWQHCSFFCLRRLKNAVILFLDFSGLAFLLTFFVMVALSLLFTWIMIHVVLLWLKKNIKKRLCLMDLFACHKYLRQELLLYIFPNELGNIPNSLWSTIKW